MKRRVSLEERSAIERRARMYYARVLTWGLAKDLVVGWATEIPGVCAIAVPLPDIGGPPLLIICEKRWLSSTKREQMDTLLHELAHLLAWHLFGPRSRSHGSEFRRARRMLDKAAGY